MCGIVGYIGGKEAAPILVNGLKKLEYRGYDSAGIAVLENDFLVYKQSGKVSNLEAIIDAKVKQVTTGIAHTRWATHGEPTQENAHPHTSNNGEIILVHNGIIENYKFLKDELIRKGFHFLSQTDTEVLVNYIQYIQDKNQLNIEDALKKALQSVNGAYALAVLDKKEPNKMVVTRKGSPLAIGVTDTNDEFYVASDAIPIVEHTQSLVYLNDDEVVTLERGKKLKVQDIYGVTKGYKVKNIDLDLNQVNKGKYEHYMLKEIFEQPSTIENTLYSHLNNENTQISFDKLEELKEKLIKAKRIIIVSCGTSWHAGIVGEYVIEELARIPVEVEYASEFRYRNPIITDEDIVMAISQSGETADTLAALRYSKSMGATTFCICNVFGSSMSRECDFTAYTYAGAEVGVASTKAFTAQVAVITLLGIQLGLERGTISKDTADGLVKEIKSLPLEVNKVLNTEKHIKSVAKNFVKSSSFLFLGRGINFPIALEGALKLKEISYIHAEGYPAAEMKHGPIALIEESLPTLMIATNNNFYDKLVSNAQEIKARKGPIVAVVNEDDDEMTHTADFVFKVPRVSDILQPIIAVVPLQLFSYHVAVYRGCNVDQPRNLAKSVTVE
ncbi:glutamine--fructose-6-phosphate transaminase (isomerizing) [Ochrovirga pacifica]|uniref:glutamine--fructose-6-phosphate transaminase (isomerizing) n=1 Tax=Ochrovirga pacifica TaxID=1042376 RepID=UPI0002557B53|nr:glutamine--fructose-6-phosphate transaminase (isomerizing) [Ochrovirga pacifica]